MSPGIDVVPYRARVVVVAVLASCAVAASLGACARANPPAPPAFAALIAYRDTIRPLDPCGYLDDAAVREIGTPSYIGAQFGFELCSADFEASPERKSDWVAARMDSAKSVGHATPGRWRHDVDQGRRGTGRRLLRDRPGR